MSAERMPFGMAGMPARKTMLLIGAMYVSETPFGVSAEDFAETVMISMESIGLSSYIEVGASNEGTSYIGFVVKELRDSVIGISVSPDGELYSSGDSISPEVVNIAIGRWVVFAGAMKDHGVVLPPPTMIIHEGFHVDYSAMN